MTEPPMRPDPATLEDSLQFLKMLNRTYDPAIACTPKKYKNFDPHKIYARMFTALFVQPKRGNNSNVHRFVNEQNVFCL